MAVPQSVLHGFDMNDWWGCGGEADARRAAQRLNPRLIFILAEASRKRQSLSRDSFLTLVGQITSSVILELLCLQVAVL